MLKSGIITKEKLIADGRGLRMVEIMDVEYCKRLDDIVSVVKEGD